MADVDVYAPRLLRETVDWAAFYKPPGRETVSETGQPDLLGALAELMPGLILIPVHRLDRDTSGVQLLAKNEDAAERLAALFRRREVDKEYLAVCLGAPGNRAGRVNRG